MIIENEQQEKYILFVDSHNHARTFGVSRSKELVEHNERILELPPKEIIFKEVGYIEDTMLLFPFGRYIVIYQFEKEILFFIDFNLEVDKPILELLLQDKVSDTCLEHFFNIQFNQQITFRTLDDTVIIKRGY